MSNDDDAMQSMFEVLDELQKIIEFVVGYRAQLIAAGYSDEAAEKMSVDLHESIMKNMAKSND
jgi:hypothetical protein